MFKEVLFTWPLVRIYKNPAQSLKAILYIGRTLKVIYFLHDLLCTQAAVLLEFVSGFINKKKEKRSEIPMEAVEVEITKFLEMLVNHVELRANNAVELLKVLQCSKLLSKKYRKIVTNMVSI